MLKRLKESGKATFGRISMFSLHSATNSCWQPGLCGTGQSQREFRISLEQQRLSVLTCCSTREFSLVCQRSGNIPQRHSGVLLDFASSALTTSWACSFLKSLRRRSATGCVMLRTHKTHTHIYIYIYCIYKYTYIYSYIYTCIESTTHMFFYIV